MTVTKPENELELRRALERLIHRPGMLQADTDQQIRILLRHAEKRGLSLDQCLVAKVGDQVASCCLCVDSPGRTSAVYIPAWIPDARAADDLVCLLNEAANQAGRRNIHFLQAIIPIEASTEPQILREAGFEHLAELIYMERDLTRTITVDKPPPAMQWLTYSRQTHHLFARTVLETYEGSLDCARLNGLRDIEEIMATHRACGVFSPKTWLLGLVDGEPAGVLLLSALPEQSSYEVVYMGLRAAHRGKGYATALLQRGARIAGDQAALRLTLAVDAKNTPARRLYERLGFCEVIRRAAWIRILDSATCQERPGACSVP